MTRKQLEALMAWVNAKFEDIKFDDLQTGIQLIEAEERLLSLFNEEEGDEENDPQTPDSEAVERQQACSNRLEALRLKLCSIGLHPLHHETPEKAASAVCAMIAYFRRENLDPSHHLQCAVLRKLRVFGYMEEGDPSPLYQLVPYPNNTEQK